MIIPPKRNGASKAAGPAIIDFYADWCGPCKMVAPVLEQLSKEYEGKLDIYKVDTEVEMELAWVFNIRSIPTFLFIPLWKAFPCYSRDPCNKMNSNK